MRLLLAVLSLYSNRVYSQIPLDEAVLLSEMGPQSFNTINYIIMLLVNATAIYMLIISARSLMQNEYHNAAKMLLIAAVVAASEDIVVDMINF